MTKKYKIATLGCRTNQYEAQAYRDQLEAMGYVAAADGDVADVCIVNTCTVTAGADRDSRHAVRQLARQHPGSKIVVTGCAAESHKDKLLSIGGVTHLVPNAQKEQLLQIVFPDEEIPEFSIRHFDSHTRAFVKVQDGCNSFCTYCIIPYVRGRSRSRPVSDVLKEVQGLVTNGYKEVVITGINVGDFDGADEPARLADLVRAVDNVPGIERVRVSSIDPDEVDDDLLDAIINGRHTCRSMHLVLQSGSNVILKRMNRKYTRHVFMETFERLRHAAPDFTATTDVIVGFPGETEADIEETLDVMRQVKFAKVHVFPFSARERTRAATMPNQIPVEVIQERKQRLLRVAEQSAFELRERFVGCTMRVLTEGRDVTRPGEIPGHTDNFLMVWTPSDAQANELIDVELVENTAEGLIGRAVPMSEVLCASQ